MIEPNMNATESESTGTTPEPTATPQADSGNTGGQAELQDLEKLERFKFDGKETTYKDLKSAYMRQEDYTRKTQELSQERNFYDNLPYDLARVRKNPELAAKFKELYPEKYHSFLDETPQGQPQAKAGQATQSQNALDPAFVSRLDQIEKMVTEDKVAAIETKLEAQDQRLGAKYGMADIEAVYARAQGAHAKGTKLTDETWEKIWKDDHEKHVKRYESHYKTQVNNQKEAIARSKDTGSGGGIPGQAPQRVSLKDVGESIIRGQS